MKWIDKLFNFENIEPIVKVEDSRKYVIIELIYIKKPTIIPGVYDEISK